MKSVFEDAGRCCGCGACYHICPVKAIEMKPDAEGFLYPARNEKACTGCRLCEAVCPISAADVCRNSGEPDCFAVKHCSRDVLRQSSSGGAFTALSDAVFKEGGAVYGAAFGQGLCVRHKRAVTAQQRDSMRISKYAQSDVRDVFYEVKNDLMEGKWVLFTGTPCQNAGLKLFLRQSAGDEMGTSVMEKLILCDLICHSVPSPLIWRDFKELLEKEYGGELESAEFRTKDLPWTRSNSKKTFTFRVKNGDKAYIDNRFYDLFFRRMTIMRPSCENCPFASPCRVGDITIADYWGIEKYAPEWYDPLGVSLALVSTEKGWELLHRCESSLKLEKRPFGEALAEQPRLSGPVKYPPERDEFWKQYWERGLKGVL